jgi:hypothetical protein
LKQIRQSSETQINDDGTISKNGEVIKYANFVFAATTLPAAFYSLRLQPCTNTYLSTGD